MADEVLFELIPTTSHSSATEYRLAAGRTYTFTCDGGDSGVWQFSDDGGTGWTNFSAGGGLNFTAEIPQDGRIRLNNGGSGPTLAGFMLLPK